MLQRYGASNSMHVESIKEKQKKTIREKYGVDFVCQIPHVYALAHSHESRIKAHETKVKNQTYKKSWVEVELFMRLAMHVKLDQQIRLDRHYSIDMFDVEGKTYLQFDGVHWHGLDKECLASNNRHEKIIYNKFYRDRELDKYVIDQKLRLIRITDVHYKMDKERAVNTILKLFRDISWNGVTFLGEDFVKHGLSL